MEGDMFYVLFPRERSEPAVILRAAGAPRAEDYPEYGFVEGPFDEYQDAIDRAVAIHGGNVIGAGESILMHAMCPDSPTGRHIANPARFGDLICVWCLEPSEGG